MKIKTSELIGPALDWAVAKCEGVEVQYCPSYCYTDIDEDGLRNAYEPSTSWKDGGPIIEREGVGVYRECKANISAGFVWSYVAGVIWEAIIGVYYVGAHEGSQQGVRIVGPTPLIAAMRCYVASKLGDEIEIPEELK